MGEVVHELSVCHAMGYSDRAKYETLLTKLDATKLPENWTLAVRKAVAKMGVGDDDFGVKRKDMPKDDAARDAIVADMTAMKWTSEAVSRNALRDFIVELEEVMKGGEKALKRAKQGEDCSTTSSDNDGSESDSSGNSKNKNYSAMKKMIGTRKSPKLGKTFLGALNIAGTECPAVVTEAVRMELKTTDERELAKLLLDHGPGNLNEAWTKSHGFGMVWSFMKRVAQVVMQACMKHQGAQVSREALSKAYEDDEFAKIGLAAIAQTAKIHQDRRRFTKQVAGGQVGKTCFLCGSPQHIAKFCPQRRSVSAAGVVQTAGATAAIDASKSEPNPASKVKGCYKCGEKTHQADNCPNGLKCFNCNQKGHKSTEWPPLM